MRKKLLIFLVLVVAIGSSILVPTISKRVFGFGSSEGFQATPNALPAYTGTLTPVENLFGESTLDPHYVKGGGAINTASANAVAFNDSVASEAGRAAIGTSDSLPGGGLEPTVFSPNGDNGGGSVPLSGPGGPFGGGAPDQVGGSVSNGPGNSNQGSPHGGGGSGGGGGGGSGGGGGNGGGGGKGSPFGPDGNIPTDLGEEPPFIPTSGNNEVPSDKPLYNFDTPPNGGDALTDPLNPDSGVPQKNGSVETVNQVPDSGTTLALFGATLAALVCLRRKIS